MNEFTFNKFLINVVTLQKASPEFYDCYYTAMLWFKIVRIKFKLRQSITKKKPIARTFFHCSRTSGRATESVGNNSTYDKKIFVSNSPSPALTGDYYGSLTVDSQPKRDTLFWDS